MFSRLRRPKRTKPSAELTNEIIGTNVVLAHRLDRTQYDRLAGLTRRLLQTKDWEASRGFELSDEMMVTIAANAALPVLSLDLALYRNVRSIIVRPHATISSGLRSGPVAGVVSDAATSIIGEAAPNAGPVSIAWDAARRDSLDPEAAQNVVIHEFAHKIDMSDGYTDGTPPLRGPQLDRWADLLADEFERAESRPDDIVLRPYAWANSAEFFAVSTEVFFCTPSLLRRDKPALYTALADFYQWHPAG